MKRLVLIISSLLFCFAPVAQAEFSFRSIRNTVSKSFNCLVDNAWAIAGSACLSAGVGLAASLGYQHYVCSYPLEDTAKAMIAPVALGIGSLLCFNFGKQNAKYDAFKNKVNKNFKQLAEISAAIMYHNFTLSQSQSDRFEEIQNVDNFLGLLDIELPDSPNSSDDESGKDNNVFIA